MKGKLLLAGALAFGTFQTASANEAERDIQVEMKKEEMAAFGHPGGGGHAGGGHVGGGHPASGGHPMGGGHSVSHPVGGHGGFQGGFHGGPVHTGHITNPHHLQVGPAPEHGWRGHDHFIGGFHYRFWNWAYGPWIHSPYFNWHVGLNYYIVEGLVCQATNTYVGGTWTSGVYNFSDDSINSAIGFCQTDQNVVMNGAQANCQITHCDRSW